MGGFDLSNPVTLLTVFVGIFSVLGVIFSIIIKYKHWKTILIALLITILIGGSLLTLLQVLSQRNTQANTWTPALEVFAPWCDTSTVDKPAWAIPDSLKSSTQHTCLPNQQLEITPSPTATLAEIDLDRINGQTYSQTKLDVVADISFLEQTPDPNTLAGLVVQTPQQGAPNGYGLAVNNTGYWELGNSSRKSLAHQNGSQFSRTIFTIEMKVQQGKLSCWINGQALGTFPDPLDPSPGAVALVIYGRPPLSPVLFSNFTLNL